MKRLPHPHHHLLLTAALGAAAAATALLPAGAGARPGVPSSDAPLTFSVMTDRPLLARSAGPQECVVRIEITGQPPRERRVRPPLNLAVVLDRSGSMSGAKLEQARQAAEMLVSRLSPEDVFSLVTYDSDVEILVSPGPVGGRTDDILRRIRGIEPGGSTALYHGVETGGRQLAEYFDEERINRVILLSDGLANVGPSSNREIAELGRSLARQGRSVTTIGLGADYHEDLMTALAEASDANFHHVADVETLPEVFERELGELEATVARRLVIEIELPDGVEPLGLLGRDESVPGRRSRVAFSTLAANQRREIYLACRIDPARWIGTAAPVATATLSYLDAAGRTEHRLSGEAVAKAVEDTGLADRAQVREITAQAEVYRNTDATREAIALADEGRTGEARAVIDAQIKRLRDVQASAPAAAAGEIEHELRQLSDSQRQFEAGGLSKEGRKQLQWNVFQRSHSKSVSPEASPQP